jgi:ech hydrogenase subunit D
MTESRIDLITPKALLERVQAFKQDGWRLVQIGATRRPDEVELTYSFDLNSRLANLRLLLPAVDAKVPSISSIFWCAFLYENEIHDLFNVAVEGIAVDFKGNLYQTRVKFPFGTAKAAAVPKVVPAAAPVGMAVTTGVIPSPLGLDPIMSSGRMGNKTVPQSAPVSA